MSTLIIHLSDLHLNSKIINGEIDISSFLNIYKNKEKFSKCFLVFTGDCTQSGKAKEIDEFRNLINSLLDGLRTNLGIGIVYYVVPGNHDNDLIGGLAPEINEIKESYKRGYQEVENLYRKTKSSMKNIFGYCRENSFDFFSNSVLYRNDSVDRNNLYNFVLVNSAPFSCLEHADKDFHYIPANDREIIGNPKYGQKTVEVLVSQHRPDWFEEKSNQSILYFQNNIASICLYGHDHRNSNYAQIRGDESVIISEGGHLFINNNSLCGNFAQFIINEENGTCEATSLKYDKRFNKFTIENSYVYKLRFNNPLQINEEFSNEVINPELYEGIKERDAFVFPTLIPNDKKETIDSFDQLMKFISNNRKIILSGYSNSGKSAIIHRLFESYDPDKWRIYLNCSSIKERNMEKVIKNHFDDEYKYANDLWNDFVKSDADEKIIYLDNYDKISNKSLQKNLIDYCEKEFGYIIVSTSETDIKSFKDSFVGTFGPDKIYSISGFSFKKRIELYKRFSRILNVTKDEDVERIISCIEASIKTCNIIDMSDPYYLCALADQTIRRELYIERNTSDAFNVVFSYSIDNALVKASSQGDLNNLISILCQLCFDITFAKKSLYFSSSDLEKAIKKRKETFQNIRLTFDKTLEILKKTKLIKVSGDEYRFQRSSYVSYFAAKEIVRLYQKGDTKYLKKAVSNIVDGINSDIFLFAAYELKQIDVFFKIQDFLDDILKGFDEIDFVNHNNALLVSGSVIEPETKAQSENKKEFYDRIDRSERKIIAKAEEEDSKVYNREYDEQSKAILKAMKMIEISSKAIAGFDNEIEAGDRELLIDKTISSLLRLANLAFSFSEQEIKEINESFEQWKENQIKALEEKNEKQERISILKNLNLIDELHDFLIIWVLNVEHFVAEIMSSDTSLTFIEKMSDNGFCRKLFKLMSFSVSGKADKFINYLDKIYDKNDKQIKNILDRIIRVFVIHNQLDYKQRSKISSLAGISEKRLLWYSGQESKK